ncbi:G2/mitotic-specific cyclin-4 [Cladobotryum mycophilum]|uniref:G2/mitotic-specific cyclin-4 n=1 Tax=Cladobotryum mycophilum TaxID=491253 RepID=A0ABR0SM62_9HYPO
MDARPFRPRGAENSMHQLHQRHKSTGNLATMTSVPAAGFRGPAKRSAFGDVTNVSKALGARDEFKSNKMPTTTIIAKHANSAVSINKENAPYPKDSFSRPAQRPAALTTKPKVFTENRPDLARKTTASVAQESAANLYKFDMDIPQQQQQQQHARANAVTNKKMPVFQGSADAPPLQPRHHKSQPQLKPQQPTLRRTQSKLESTHLLPEEVGPTRVSTESLGMPAPYHGHSNDHAYLDSLCIPLEPESRVVESHAEDLPAKLADISEEPGNDIPYKEGPTLALSEPEECWDEDEDEDYDDQDQAYTTAHSTKSRDLTIGNATTVLAPESVLVCNPEEVEEEAWDVSMVAEYGDEIFAYMRELEIRMSPNPHYMDMQTEIQWSMRSVLMDWVVQVHNRFNLLPETLFLTVNYIDRFLSCKIVSIGKLQLVGATAILVASKYEEINCPSLDEIVYMVDGGYTTEEVLKAERFMLSMLSFELGWPGPMSFLRRVSKADDYDLETRTLAKYFMELTIMDERFVASPPSFVAAGAHCLARLILNKGDWSKHHVFYSGYTWGQLKSLVTMMVECCENPQQHHSAVFDKYKEKRFKEASILVQGALDAGFTLPHHALPVRRDLTHTTHLEEMVDHSKTGVLISIES